MSDFVLPSGSNLIPEKSGIDSIGSPTKYFSDGYFNNIHGNVVSSSGNYLPLTGGTLTGPLTGTSAYWSGNNTINGQLILNSSANYYNSESPNITSATYGQNIYISSASGLFATAGAGDLYLHGGAGKTILGAGNGNLEINGGNGNIALTAGGKPIYILGGSQSIQLSGSAQLNGSDLITSGIGSGGITVTKAGNILTISGTSPAGSYLSLTGGTLTGGLSGTTAYFSGDIGTSGNLISYGDISLTSATAGHSITLNPSNGLIMYGGAGDIQINGSSGKVILQGGASDLNVYGGSGDVEIKAGAKPIYILGNGLPVNLSGTLNINGIPIIPVSGYVLPLAMVGNQLTMLSGSSSQDGYISKGDWTTFNNAATATASDISTITSSGAGISLFNSKTGKTAYLNSISGLGTVSVSSQNNGVVNISGLGTRITIANNETPSGLINNSNTTYTLVGTPYNNSLELFQDGSLLNQSGVSTVYDYTLSANTITMLKAPLSGTNLIAQYYYLNPSGADITGAYTATISGITGPNSTTTGAIATWSNASGTALANTAITVSPSGTLNIPSSGNILFTNSGTNNIGASGAPAAGVWTNNVNGYPVAYQPIYTQTVVSGTNVRISGLSAGNNYSLQTQLQWSGTAGLLYMRFNNDSTTNYNGGGTLAYYGNGTTSTVGVTASDHIALSDNGGLTIGLGNIVKSRVEFQALPINTKFANTINDTFYTSGAFGNYVNIRGGYLYSGTSAVTEVDLVASAGNFNGTIKLYQL